MMEIDAVVNKKIMVTSYSGNKSGMEMVTKGISLIRKEEKYKLSGEVSYVFQIRCEISGCFSQILNLCKFCFIF